MKTRRIFWLLLLAAGFTCFTACINKDYDWTDDNIDKNIVFSPDGFAFPLGGVDTVLFNDLNIIPVIGDEYEASTSYTVEGLFNEDTKDVFFREGSGAVELSFDLTVFIAQATHFNLVFSPSVLDENGNVLFSMEPQTVENQSGATPMTLTITESHMEQMENAYSLKFDIYFEAQVSEFQSEDYFSLNDMVVSKAGGIYLNLDDM